MVMPLRPSSKLVLPVPADSACTSVLNKQGAQMLNSRDWLDTARHSRFHPGLKCHTCCTKDDYSSIVSLNNFLQERLDCPVM